MCYGKLTLGHTLPPRHTLQQPDILLVVCSLGGMKDFYKEQAQADSKAVTF